VGEFYTLRKTAQELSLSEYDVRKLVDSQQLPAEPHPRERQHWRIPKDAVEAFKKQHGVARAADGGGESSVEDQQRASEDSPKRSGFFERLGAVSGIVAATAGAIYSLGLIALWAPIVRAYTGDFSTAWYAVSLLPNTVVAGQGVRQLVVGPLSFSLLIIIAILLWGFARATALNVGLYLGVRYGGSLEGALFLNAAVLVVLSNLMKRVARVLLWIFTMLLTFIPTLIILAFVFGFSLEQVREVLGVASSVPSTPSDSPTLLAYAYAWVVSGAAIVLAAAAYIAPAVVGGLVGRKMLLATEFQSGRRLPRIVDKTAFWKAAARGLGVALAGAFVLAAFAPPPLPRVAIEQALPDETQTTTSGALLTQTGGFWYVFEEVASGPDVLKAIPSGEVKEVRFLDR